MDRAPHKNLISVSDGVTSETYEILLSSRGEFLSKSYLFGTIFVARCRHAGGSGKRPNGAHGRIERNSVMSDYEEGRKAKREGRPLESNPYWGWFRRCAWERGWVDEDTRIYRSHESKRPIRSNTQASLKEHEARVHL